MSRLPKLVLIAVAALSATSAIASDISASITIGQPGFYGRIDIGNAPTPQLIYAQPIIVAPVVRPVAPQPVYLRVPPGHAKKWDKHCGRYNACNVPVYFVNDRWYEQTYVPYYAKQKGKSAASSEQDENGQGNGKGKGHGKGHGKQKD